MDAKQQEIIRAFKPVYIENAGCIAAMKSRIESDIWDFRLSETITELMMDDGDGVKEINRLFLHYATAGTETRAAIDETMLALTGYCFANVAKKALGGDI